MLGFNGADPNAPCGNPECQYLQHSNAEEAECVGFCCQKCMGLMAGEEWAIGGKKHYSQCEKREAGDPVNPPGTWGNQKEQESPSPMDFAAQMSMAGFGGAMGADMKCGNPDCEYAQHSNPDEAGCHGFCCQKCMGVVAGEEWAMGGGKKHYAQCEKRRPGESLHQAADSWGASTPAYGGPRPAHACANPECEYAACSDPIAFECGPYCCGKCQARHRGDEWAMSGKKHYKSCEKMDYSEMGMQGMGGMQVPAWQRQSMGMGKGMGKGGGQHGFGGSPLMGNPMFQKMMQNPKFMAMFAKAKGKGMDMGMGMGASRGGAWGQGAAAQGGGAWGAAKAKSLRNFTSEKKVWVGNVPEGATGADLTEHFKQLGSRVACAEINKHMPTVGGVAFSSADEANFAITQMNGSVLGDQALEIASWADAVAAGAAEDE